MTLRCNGQLLDLSRPVVMGILNVTPDSFFDGGKYPDESAMLKQAEKMLREGAAILDIGGASSRPGAEEVGEAEEMRRVIPTIEVILKNFPDTILSVDTWRANVARAAVDAGASIVNDISAGSLDPKMFETVASLGTPYILMHIQGAPGTMQKNPHYKDVVTEVLDFFVKKIETLRGLGVRDIVLDPGFGFGKTLAHNYTLLKNLHVFRNVLGLPVLAGLSRKSMIWKPLGITPAEALNGTSALHVVALQQGASILRAHDVREAAEVVRLWEVLLNDEL
ncbi:MAG: dihydropteroate synthase [Saprospiraceae bacterium]